MNRNAVAVLLALAAGAIAGATAGLLANPSTAAASGAPEPGAVARLDQHLESLDASLKAVVERLGALESRMDEAPAREPLAPAKVDAAQAATSSQAATDSKDADADGPAFDLDGALAQITDPTVPWADREAVWKQLKEAGMLDAALAALEAKVKLNPSDADLRTHLGGAYLQKLFTVAEGPEKGVWAMKADAAFDQALQINPRHWDARFSKAMSLSFWPPIFGKQSEAISQFETLVTQQEQNGDFKPQYAQSYVFLGNLYQQQGNVEKAKEIWTHGAQLFPQNEELNGKAKP